MRFFSKIFPFLFLFLILFGLSTQKAEANYMCPADMFGKTAADCFSFPDGASGSDPDRTAALNSCRVKYGSCVIDPNPAQTAQVLDNKKNSSDSKYASCGRDITGLCTAFWDLMYWVISLPLLIASLFLYVAGALFDNSLAFTISNFSANYATYFSTGVDQVWGSFRDVGNIVMIGVFVYIAFRTMLGMESFGMKSFAARLVIVALLINFSLFFTKIIVDVSNITAIQFVRATGTAVGSTSGVLGTGVGQQTNATSIAQVFADRAGLKGISMSGAADVVRGIGADDKLPGGSTIRYILLTTIFFLAVGSVLLYGAILLITRMVVLILLMITSSFAWVSYMTPKLEKFWGMWWDNMIRYALFAPVYMLLVWASIQLTRNLAAPGGGASADSKTLVDLTTSGGVFEATIKIAFIVGLLYASTKIADSLSIAGAKFAKSVSLKGFSYGLRATGAGLAIGAGERLANAGLKGFAKTAQGINDRLARTPVLNNLSSARLDAQLKKLQEKQIGLADSKLAKATGLTFGKAASEKDQKAYDQRLLEDAAKKDLTEALAKGKDIRNEAAGQAPEPGQPASPAAGTSQQTAEMSKEQARKIIEAGKRENASRTEDLQTLRAQLTGATASGNKQDATNIQRKITDTQKAISEGTTKISDLAEKLQAAEAAELRQQAERGTFAADALGVAASPIPVPQQSAGGGTGSPQGLSEIKDALAKLTKTEETRRRNDLKAYSDSKARDKEMADAVRELATMRAQGKSGGARSDSEKRYWADIAGSISKGKKTEQERAFETIADQLKQARAATDELAKLKSQQKPNA